MAIRPSQAVKVVSLIDGDVLQFSSQAKAAKHFQIGHSIIANRLASGKAWNNWRFELCNNTIDQGKDIRATEPINPLAAMFGEEFASAFQGKQVRVTHDMPRRISVFDLISIVAEVENPRCTWTELCEQHPEVVGFAYNFKFPGAGQRPTPVVSVQDAITIINIMKGKHAASMRAGQAKLLVHYLGGDESQVDEVQSTTAVPQPPVAATGLETIDPMIYLLGPDAYELLLGKSIRTTHDGRLSLYDFIEAITENEHAGNTWRNIRDRVPEVAQILCDFQFPGAGQRPTPVITVQEAILVANHLRGPLADHLRKRCAELGKDMAGGNVNKLTGIATAIDAHHRAGRADGTLAALCRTAHSPPTYTLDIAAPALLSEYRRPEHKFMIMSPRQTCLNLTLFSKKPVCYLLCLRHEDKPYLKVGYSCDFLERLNTHMREIPDLIGVWFVVEAPAAVETAYKDHMRYCGKLVSLKVGGKMQTELLADIDPHTAELELCKQVANHQISSSLEIRKLELETELKKEQLKAETERMRLELEADREMKRMEILAQLVQSKPDLSEQLIKLFLINSQQT